MSTGCAGDGGFDLGFSCEPVDGPVVEIASQCIRDWTILQQTIDSAIANQCGQCQMDLSTLQSVVQQSIAGTIQGLISDQYTLNNAIYADINESLQQLFQLLDSLVQVAPDQIAQLGIPAITALAQLAISAGGGGSGQPAAVAWPTVAITGVTGAPAAAVASPPVVPGSTSASGTGSGTDTATPSGSLPPPQPGCGSVTVNLTCPTPSISINSVVQWQGSASMPVAPGGVKIGPDDPLKGMKLAGAGGKIVEAAVKAMPNWDVNLPQLCANPPANVGAALNGCWITDLIGLRGGDPMGDCGDIQVPGWLDWINRIPFLGDQIPTALANAIAPFTDAVSTILANIFQSCNVVNPVAPSLNLLDLLIGLAEKYTGANLSNIRYRIMYSRNYLCPYTIPSGGDADNLFIRGVIDQKQWQCWSQANGRLTGPATTVRDAQQTRLQPQDALVAQLRAIPGAPPLDRELRWAGITDPAVLSTIKALADRWPDVAQALDWCRRQLYDEQLMAKLGIADIPDCIGNGPLAAYIRAGNLETQSVRYWWRQLWQEPGYRQVRPWVQKLRGSNVPPQLQLTPQDIFDLAQRQGMPRYWAERELAYYDVLEEEAGQKEDATKAYIRGGVSLIEAERQLLNQGYTASQISRILIWARQQIAIGVREDCTNAIRQEYLTGGLTDQAARLALAGNGLDADWINETITGWRCLKTARGPRVGAQELCRWLGQGLIRPAEVAQRLVLLGYSTIDAARVLKTCEISISKAQQAAAAKAIRSAETQAKQLAAAAKARAAAVAKLTSEADRQLLERVKVANKLAIIMGIDVEEALTQLGELVPELSHSWRSDIPTTWQIVGVYISDWAKSPPGDWQAALRATSPALEQAQAAVAAQATAQTTNGVAK